MWPNPQETTGLVIFTEEVLMENLIFCAVYVSLQIDKIWTLSKMFLKIVTANSPGH